MIPGQGVIQPEAFGPFAYPPHGQLPIQLGKLLHQPGSPGLLIVEPGQLQPGHVGRTCRR